MNNSCCHNSDKINHKFSYKSVIFASILFIFYLFVNQNGLLPTLSLNQNTFLPVFIVFGLTAAISTCGGLTSSILLSLPGSHRPFLFGRLFFFSLFGLVLGSLGHLVSINTSFFSVFIIVISIILILNSIQMLGFSFLPDFGFHLPQKFTKSSPFILGGLTFFLPCGFTFTAQSLALSSGNPLSGLLIMFFFSLGATLPFFLLPINKMKKSPLYSHSVAIFIIFFSLFTIFTHFSFSKDIPSGLAPVENNIQIIRMSADSQKYSPNNFKIKAGIPVRWEITDKGVSGCTNTIISKSLLSEPLRLKPLSTTVITFDPPKNPGIYRFTCWMGMVSGTIEVIN